MMGPEGSEQYMQSPGKWATLIMVMIRLAWPGNASAANACSNLSGKYMIQGEDGQVHITINQHACARIEIVRATSYLGAITTEKHFLSLDGNLQADRQWIWGRLGGIQNFGEVRGSQPGDQS